MPAAISDSSVLIHLARIGKLELLQALYGRVAIPPAVRRETVEEGRGRPGAEAIRKAIEEGWVAVHAAPEGRLLHALLESLDAGEAEALALAAGSEEVLVLIDERQARKVAASLGLRVTGTIGVLSKAKRDGQIASLRGALDALRREGAFWISEALYRRALKDVGEEPVP